MFQVLPIDGQNDGSVEELLIDAEQFRSFVLAGLVATIGWVASRVGRYGALFRLAM